MQNVTEALTTTTSRSTATTLTKNLGATTITKRPIAATLTKSVRSSDKNSSIATSVHRHRKNTEVSLSLQLLSENRSPDFR